MVLYIDDDFDLDKIAESGQCFRWERVGGGWRIPHKGRCLTIEKLSAKEYRLDCAQQEFETLWRPYFDLDESYAAIRERIEPERDPFLYRAAAYGRGIRILRQDPWETLISFIISQNRNIPAIRRSVELLCRAAGKPVDGGGGEPVYSFPTPEEILSLDREGLALCRLGYRDRYVLAAAERVADNKHWPEALAATDVGAAVAALTGFLGVGVKVASCVALFGLHRLDAFPVDVWMRRALSAEYPQGYPHDEYSPYNGVYQQYIFYCYRSGKN